jgi:hypothetical protein
MELTGARWLPCSLSTLDFKLCASDFFEKSLAQGLYAASCSSLLLVHGMSPPSFYLYRNGEGLKVETLKQNRAG